MIKRPAQPIDATAVEAFKFPMVGDGEMSWLHFFSMFAGVYGSTTRFKPASLLGLVCAVICTLDSTRSSASGLPTASLFIFALTGLVFGYLQTYAY